MSNEKFTPELQEVEEHINRNDSQPVEKFTKGPWHTGIPRFGYYVIYADHTCGGGRCVTGRQAICGSPHEGKNGCSAHREMFTANANLIAAAPKMYEKLSMMRRKFSVSQDEDLIILGLEIEELLKEARGEE